MVVWASLATSTGLRASRIFRRPARLWLYRILVVISVAQLANSSDSASGHLQVK